MHSLKRRRGEFNAPSQVTAFSDIDTFAARFSPLALTLEADLLQAQISCRNADPGLRAGDSVHLVIALRLSVSHRATLAAVLAKNAAAHGIAIANTLPA